MPSRKKKQKTHHTGPNGSLSQAEIWDDSALIRSWNDALAEYEYYHSIHARGEDAEEILRKAEEDEIDRDDEQQANGGWQPINSEVKLADAIMTTNGDSASAAEVQDRAEDDEDEEGEIIEEGPLAKAQELLGLHNARKAAIQTLTAEAESLTAQQQDIKLPATAAAAQERPSGAVAAPMIGPSLPPAENSVSAEVQIEEAPPQDQTLENIKMAYYWAGYYSGLYDGQRRAANKPQSQPPM